MGGVNDDAVDESELILCCALCCANASVYSNCDCFGCSAKVSKKPPLIRQRTRSDRKNHSFIHFRCGSALLIFLMDLDPWKMNDSYSCRQSIINHSYIRPLIYFSVLYCTTLVDVSYRPASAAATLNVALNREHPASFPLVAWVATPAAMIAASWRRSARLAVL